MRIDLNVPFVRKDEAKGQGARWDPKKRVWYVHLAMLSNAQISALFEFIPAGALKRLDKARDRKERHHERMADGFATERTDFSLPTCDCTTPPWEDCWHTAPQLDDAQAEHMRSIAAG